MKFLPIEFINIKKGCNIEQAKSKELTFSSKPLMSGRSAMTITLSFTLPPNKMADFIITKVSYRRSLQATTARTTSPRNLQIKIYLKAY